MNKRTFFSVTFLLLLQPLMIFAHHNAMSVYNVMGSITVEGEVIDLELVNPHMRLYINVKNDSGRIEKWLVDGPGKLVLAQRGWTDDMFSVGESITVIGKPTRSGNTSILFDRIIREDGMELIEPALEDELAIEAERRLRNHRGR